MSDDDVVWARELVRKIVEAERLGGGFRIFHDSAVEQIVERMRQAREKAS